MKFAQIQPPVSAYFNETFYRREIDTLFANGPHYVGHELMVPEKGNYFVLPTHKESRLLIRNNEKVELLSNVCRHRQAIMLKGHGIVENIVCPLHRWTYDLSGKLLGAPHFEFKPCINLSRIPIINCNGFLLESMDIEIQHDLISSDMFRNFNFSGHCFDHLEIHECPYNWKTFIEVYLEDYHVVPFHPGLGNFVSCENLKWEFGKNYSIQKVGLHKALKEPGSPIYHKWHTEILRLQKQKEHILLHGVIWMLYYPNLMIECYPNVLIISWLIPRGPQHTTNVIEFYYPEDIVLFEPEYVKAGRAAYMETVAEDDEIALKMNAGRWALLERGEEDIGPYQSPMEDGMRHFHEYLTRELKYS